MIHALCLPQEGSVACYYPCYYSISVVIIVYLWNNYLMLETGIVFVLICAINGKQECFYRLKIRAEQRRLNVTNYKMTPSNQKKGLCLKINRDYCVVDSYTQCLKR